MSWSWPQWKLRHLAIAIAILALSFAVIGIPATAVMAFFLSPALIAKAGRRMDVLFWMSTLYPIVGVLSLYITWIGAWFALGHPPRSSLDDPKDIDAIMVPYLLTAIFLFCSPFALLTSLGLMVARVVRSRELRWFARSSPFFIVPPVWAISYGFLLLDPLGVLYWYMD